MDSSEANFVFANVTKMLGFGQTPPSWLGQNPKFSRKKNKDIGGSQRDNDSSPNLSTLCYLSSHWSRAPIWFGGPMTQYCITACSEDPAE